ncbi:hypothetical protein M1248_27515 [Mycobacterium sp. 29Ha]|nr:hypothetical protein [Mycobacterium sp. 29Ha]
MFGVLLLIGLVITYYWFFIAAGAAVGLFFAVRALVRREQERRLAAEREAEEIAYRAERQHRWAQRGDDRGVYGVAGAELMHSISPKWPLQPSDASADEHEIAAIAYTAGELQQLIEQKPAAWRWAAFASVLVQRHAAVLPRLRDFDLRYVMPGGERAYSGPDVASFVTDSMHELSRLVEQLEGLMTAPAFVGVFGGHNEDAADADGIQHAANRLMDLHERFLALAERCRDVEAPSRYDGLVRDTTRLMGIPLEGFRVFIDDYVELVDALPELVGDGGGVVHEAVTLDIDLDDGIVNRISKQVRTAARA